MNSYQETTISTTIEPYTYVDVTMSRPRCKGISREIHLNVTFLPHRRRAMNLLFSYFSTWLQPPKPPSPWSPYPKSRTQVDHREMSREEITLEQSGDFNTLQRFRYRVYLDQRQTHPIPIDYLLATELDLRHYTQEELFAREHDDGSKKMKDFLDEVKKRIWRLAREWWSYRCQIEGVTSRAFDLWRSHPTWYMHEALVEDCIRKQGCCSRGCGCCLNRQLVSTRRLASGHCALSCGCCRKARGFRLTQTEENEIYDKLDLQQEKNFANRFQLASIWGLRLDSDRSPFDLIKSGYELAGKYGADDPENLDIDLLGTSELPSTSGAKEDATDQQIAMEEAGLKLSRRAEAEQGERCRGKKRKRTGRSHLSIKRSCGMSQSKERKSPSASPDTILPSN